VSVLLAGLERSTAYHYRLCARDSAQSGGPGCGEDRTFTTPNVDCGDVITQDVVLSSQLDCGSFATNGLIVGANGVDINLGGHRLRGPEGISDSNTPTAIDNSGGHDDVTIRNGSISSWGQAIELAGASFNVVRGLNVQGNVSGIEIGGGEGNLIRSVQGIRANARFAFGLRANGSEGLVVADSSGGFWSIGGDLVRILRNQIGGAGEQGSCLSVSGNGTRVVANVVANCRTLGIAVGPGGDNVVTDNEVSGVTAGSFGEPDGIFVHPFTANNLLARNFAHGNADDGIDVRATATRLDDNRANDNGDLGIDAAAGVTDLGGNTASGNGNPLQCRNVFCQ
jgi:hypothetical protein